MFYRESDVKRYPSEFAPLSKNSMYKLELSQVKASFFKLTNVFNLIDASSALCCREYHFSHFSHSWQFVVLIAYPDANTIRAKVYDETSASIKYENLQSPKVPLPGQLHVVNGVIGFNTRDKLDLNDARPIQVDDVITRNKSASTKKQTKEWKVGVVSNDSGELVLVRGTKQVVVHATNQQELQAYGLIWSN